MSTVSSLARLNGWAHEKLGAARTRLAIGVRVPLNRGELAGRKLIWPERVVSGPKFDRLGTIGDEDGIKMAAHEKLTADLAARLKTSGTLLEIACGIGSHTVQFARQSGKVIALDLDAVKLMCAAHNAGVYGVRHKITFIGGDMFDERLMRHFQGRVDVVLFDSPFWGDQLAENNTIANRFIEQVKPRDRFAIRLPKTLDSRQIIQALEPNELLAYHLGGELKYYVAVRYFVNPPADKFTRIDL